MEQALQTYIAESRGLLQEMEDALLGLEYDAGDAELIGALFRAAHTIKGSAGMFGLDAVVAFTHVVENLLDQLRDGKIAVNTQLIGTLLECRDHIGTLIDKVAQADESVDGMLAAEGERLLLALQDCGADSGQSGGAQLAAPRGAGVQCDGASGVDCWHISLQFGPDVLRNGMDPASFIRYLGSIGEILDLQLGWPDMPGIAQMDPQTCYLDVEIDFRCGADKQAIEDVFEFVRDDCRLRITPSPGHPAAMMDQIVVDQIVLGQGLAPAEAVDVALEKQKQVRERKNQDAKFIRVNAEKLDQLIDLVGELIIASASASLLARRSGNAALSEATSVITGFVEEIREDALRLRMVEIGETFNRLHRVVRDVSQEIGKDIGLQISGGDTELDKTVVERIGDPLTHLVRNAMDHGIEDAPLRRARGKPARGTVSLNAYHDSGSIVMEVADDGGGLDRDRILAKAIERGLVGAGALLSDGEIYNLIFEPGFSTAQTVTKLSGRGVGMDVVKRNIHALRGSVDIHSQQGAGTTVRIRLPLTLAIIDGFLVGVGALSFVVPLDMVLECLELSEADRQASRQRDYINLRGEVLPLIDLRSAFRIAGDVGRRENVVVVKCGGKKAGLIVGTLHGEFQTVIKPLNKMFSQVKCLSGSTILGSGDVALILDVPALMQQAGHGNGG